MTTRKLVTYFDSDNGMFLLRELSQLLGTPVRVKRPGLKWRDLIPPLSDGIDPGATSIRYTVWDMYGSAKLIASYSDDLPRADVKAFERESPLRSVGNSYGWNMDEVEAARFANKPLNPERRNAAMRAQEERLQKLAFFGDAGTGIPGLLNNPNIPVLTAHDPGGGGTALYWENKTADEVLKDLNDLVNYSLEQTNGTETVDTMVLPLSLYNLIKTKRVGTVSEVTVLKYFLETNEFVKDVDWLNELETADEAGTGPRVMVLRRDPEVLGYAVSREPMELPPEVRGLETIVAVVSKSGGTLVKFPMAITFMDGAGA